MPYHAELPLWEDKSSTQKIETMRQMIDDLYYVTYENARKNILKDIDDALKVFADEKEVRDMLRMRELIQQHPNILSQNCEIGHITGSALVCDSNYRVLLHYHKSLNRWLQFGGHVDYEMDIADVALREAREETGLPDLKHHLHYLPKQKPRPIDFDIHTIPASKNRPEHLHLDLRYMLITYMPNKLNPPEGESKDFLWADYRDILNPPEPDDAKLLDYALLRLIIKCGERFSDARAYTY
ncbi:MAG: hypothetical protein Phog2KO_15310 [Phototrophicaceae bacterium]